MNPILQFPMQQNGAQGNQIPFSMGQPVLMNPQQPMPGPKPVLSQQPPRNGATGNARGSMRTPGMPAVPNQQINMGGEGLMRIGGNIMGAAANGPLSAFQAGTQTYGDLMDYNRSREMDAFAIEEARRKEIQARMDAQRRASGGGGGSSPGTDQEQADDATEIARLEGLLNDLRNDPNLTGPLAGTIGNRLDRSGLGDANRAAKRLILSELQVNATLAYTAQTKGAITDREMALFQTPVPKLTDDEQVWIAWLEPQLEVLKQLQQNGITDEAAKQKGISTGTTGTATDDIDALVEQYAPSKN